jgi:polyisoprenoid-binding protein YceI
MGNLWILKGRNMVTRLTYRAVRKCYQLEFLAMKFKSMLWLPLMAVAVANASPVFLDMNRSVVEIAVKATIDSFVAQVQDYEASITVGPKTRQVETAVFRLNFASVKTGNANRDRDMNEWQQSDKFPDVVFTLTALEPAIGGKYLAHGQLRFHGVGRPISFPISIETNNQIIAMESNVTIDTRDYGLPVIKKYFILMVDPILRLHFHLQGKLAGS